MYCMGYLAFVDCYGRLRILHGGLRGGENDINVYYDSLMYKRRNNYLNNGDIILFDGIFELLGYPFLCPIGRHRDNGPPLSDLQNELNDVHRWARSIVENYFARLKMVCSLLANVFCYDLDYLDCVVRAACVLTNIHISHEGALRIL